MRFGLLFFLLLSVSIYGQDTTFVRSAYAGSSLTVPQKVTWQIEKAFINNGDGYNLKINPSVFKPLYQAGEKIQIPFYTAEMELLNNQEGVYYFLYIKESFIP
jgi:hypothetical protein